MRFKGKSFMAIVLSPENPFEDWLREVDRIISRSPGFFLNRPIVLDVRGLKLSSEELIALVDQIKSRKIQIMGMEGIAAMRIPEGLPPSISGGREAGEVASPVVDEAESDASMASGAVSNSMNSEGNASEGASLKASSREASEGRKSGETLMITEPVRSGQSILYPDGDVTIVGSVSSGAEVIAGGSIHIYGALRGRALAGVAELPDSRIFCSKLDPELLSINGLYKVADDLPKEHLHQPVQVRLENDNLIFEKL